MQFFEIFTHHLAYVIFVWSSEWLVYILTVVFSYYTCLLFYHNTTLICLQPVEETLDIIFFALKLPSFFHSEIWDALRAAAEADLSLSQTIVDSAGIIVSNPDMTLCYDERGAKYELPKYVLSEPTNLIREE